MLLHYCIFPPMFKIPKFRALIRVNNAAMAQYRQLGGLDRIGASNGTATDQFSIGIRGSHKQGRTAPPHRRLKGLGVSIGALALILSLAFIVSVFVFFSSDKDLRGYHSQDDESGNDTDFLTNVTRTQRFKVLKFGHGSVVHSRDSQYWDRDDRRRDEDYSEDVMEHATNNAQDGSDDTVHNSGMDTEKHEKTSITESYKGSAHRAVGLYNEAGRDELKMYEAKYEASLRSAGKSKNEHVNTNQQYYNAQTRRRIDEVDPDDEYDDGIGLHEIHVDYYNDNRDQSDGVDGRGSFKFINVNKKDGNIAGDGQQTSSDLHENSNPLYYDKINSKSGRKSTIKRLSVSKKKARRHKFSGSCEMKILNSTSQLIEPLEGQKFVRFSLQDTEIEEKPDGEEQWEYRFAGHQNLTQREKSFIAHDQKINCGFVGGPKGSSSTGFDLAEDDAKYINSCHIAVVSCIFGNSDRLREPMGKTVSRFSRKNVCFVMFVDETTLQTISSDGRTLDRMGFIGLWKVVMVKNLPYTDMRRVGKIPKFLSHRLFPSARNSIWLDSKLRLQLDPMLILEYFLWRKGYEYAISKHYDRHCAWEEMYLKGL